MALTARCIFPLLIFITVTYGQVPTTCTKAGTAFCETPATGLTEDNIIFRCEYNSGPPSPGNCNDDLYNVPPVGVKLKTWCWESSPSAGDAQCTFNCVLVTAANGTELYPVGCTRKGIPSGGIVSASSASLTSFGPSTATSALSSTSSKSDSTATIAPGNKANWKMLAMLGGALIL